MKVGGGLIPGNPEGTEMHRKGSAFPSTGSGNLECTRILPAAAMSEGLTNCQETAGRDSSPRDTEMRRGKSQRVHELRTSDLCLKVETRILTKGRKVKEGKPS